MGTKIRPDIQTISHLDLTCCCLYCWLPTTSFHATSSHPGCHPNATLHQYLQCPVTLPKLAHPTPPPPTPTPVGTANTPLHTLLQQVILTKQKMPDDIWSQGQLHGL
eukprot:3973276-Ditylum_brightwellii.AAC.1